MVSYRPILDTGYLAVFGSEVRHPVWESFTDSTGEEFLLQSFTFPAGYRAFSLITAFFFASMSLAAVPALQGVTLLIVYIMLLILYSCATIAFFKLILQSKYAVISKSSEKLYVTKIFFSPLLRRRALGKGFEVASLVRSHIEQTRSISNACCAKWYPLYSAVNRKNDPLALDMAVLQLASTAKVGFCFLVNFSTSDSGSRWYTQSGECFVLQAWKSHDDALNSPEYLMFIHYFSNHLDINALDDVVVFSQSRNDGRKWISQEVCKEQYAVHE